MKKIIYGKLIIPIFLFSQESSSSLEEFLTETNDLRKNIHMKLTNLSSSIDNYKNTKKIDLKSYDSTYAFMELSSYYIQNESIKFDKKLKLKLKLPNIQSRLKLLIESDDDRKRESKNYIEEYEKNINDNFNLSAIYKEKIEDLDFDTKIGIKLKDKLDPFVKSEAKKYWLDVYGLDYTISQIVKLSKSKKIETTSYFLVDKPINNTFSLHNYNEYYWYSEKKRDSEFYHSIYLNQKLSKKNYLTYQIDTSIDNENSNLKVKRYSGSLKFRHYIKNWLYTDVIPENFYSEILDFKPRYAIKFNIGMYFSKDSYR